MTNKNRFWFINSFFIKQLVVFKRHIIRFWSIIIFIKICRVFVFSNLFKFVQFFALTKDFFVWSIFGSLKNIIEAQIQKKNHRAKSEYERFQFEKTVNHEKKNMKYQKLLKKKLKFFFRRWSMIWISIRFQRFFWIQRNQIYLNYWNGFSSINFFRNHYQSRSSFWSSSFFNRYSKKPHLNPKKINQKTTLSAIFKNDQNKEKVKAYEKKWDY